MSQAAQAAAQPPLLGLASASLSSPFGILSQCWRQELFAERRALDAHSPAKGNTKKVLKVMDKPEVKLYRVGTTLKSSNSKLTPQVPGKGILLSKPVPPPNTGDGKVTCLDELPTHWWTVVDNASGGYQSRPCGGHAGQVWHFVDLHRGWRKLADILGRIDAAAFCVTGVTFS